MDGQEVIRRCRVLAEFTEEPGHITRTFLSPPMREVHRVVREWMEQAGMRVWVDAVGNIRGVYGDGPRLMIGSHLDTVPHAGAFDGILGVVIGIALVERHPSCALEVVGFSEEEGVRFGVPFIGSRALVGDPVMDARVIDAIREFGLDPEGFSQAVIGKDVKGYLEFHIEQGPVLEQKKLPVEVVESIAGQSRFEVSFRGTANHAGSTPMNRRSDALAAAAEWVGVVERTGIETPNLVATVGQMEVQPGAANVIPGLVRATLDVRSACDATRLKAVRDLLDAAERNPCRPGVRGTYQKLLDQPAVPMDAAMVRALSGAVREDGYVAHRMVSGAGHDAMILARRVPSAMLFLRSPGGVSHHPDEAVLEEDVDVALAVGMRFL